MAVKNRRVHRHRGRDADRRRQHGVAPRRRGHGSDDRQRAGERVPRCAPLVPTYIMFGPGVRIVANAVPKQLPVSDGADAFAFGITRAARHGTFRHGQRPVSKRSATAYRDPHHHHGAGAARSPHGDDLRRLARCCPRCSRISCQLRVSRHLLEQSSPHAAGHPPDQRHGAVGEPAPAVLAVAVPVRHRLDGARSHAPRSRRRCTVSSCSVGHRVLHPAAELLVAVEGRIRCWPARSAATQGQRSLGLLRRAIPLAFVNVWIARGLFVLVALLWLVPDRRIERV